MNIEQILQQRSNTSCELCKSDHQLSVYEVPPFTDANAEQCILLCDTCLAQINGSQTQNANHWRCLNDAMWNPEPAVQVMAWRQLTQLNNEAWAQDLLELFYLEPEVQQWAQATQESSNDDAPCLDSNGARLVDGDSVTLIKDLDVKGANFTAKRGTMIKNISLNGDPQQIEGKVNGTRIVLLTKFLKKAN